MSIGCTVRTTKVQNTEIISTAHLHLIALNCAAVTALEDEFGHARLSKGDTGEAREREMNLFISDHVKADVGGTIVNMQQQYVEKVSFPIGLNSTCSHFHNR